MRKISIAFTLVGVAAVLAACGGGGGDGTTIAPQPPGVVFATVGSASYDIDFPADGDWLIGIHARGTPCRGEFPRRHRQWRFPRKPHNALPLCSRREIPTQLRHARQARS